jgi:ubiquinone/menaquinone biosynthesis C-methylase UbiE
MTDIHRDQPPATGFAVSRAILESRFDDPSYPLGALYRAAMATLAAEPLAGKHVLDYASGSAEFGVWMGTENAEVHLLDPSPANIELGLKRAETSGVARRVKAIHLTDPANLDMFAADAFDLIFSRTPIAELADLPGALDEIARIMKPDARLVLAQAQAPGRAALAKVESLFAEMRSHRVASRRGLLSRFMPANGTVVITLRN